MTATMMTRKTRNTGLRLAQIMAGINLALVPLGLALGMGLSSENFQAPNWINGFVYSALAGLILARQPRHLIGWLFLVVGGLLGAGALLWPLFGQASPVTGADWVIGWAYWTAEQFWLPAYLIPITLVLQYFPDGRLPSRRWWPVTAVTVGGLVSHGAYRGFSPWPIESMGIFYPDNPLAIPALAPLLEALAPLATGALLLGVLGSLASVLVRFRRSAGIERIQMKWLVYAASVTVPVTFLTILVLGSDNPIGNYLFLSTPTVLAVSMGLAIARYRLFDIDILIRRTLQYTLLTGILVAIYFGLVVTLQALVTAVGGQRSEFFIVISTLIIAALFNPLRLRIQNVIDRRFYRNKYDAEQALAQFAAAARDEVDLEALTAALLATVNETMRPEQVSLWLKEQAAPAEE